MKIAILSDVHGNLPALEAVFNDLEDFHPDQLVFAGDFTRGPFPNEVIDLLRERNALMIIGNDDLGPLQYLEEECPPEWHTCRSYGLLRWTARQLTPENILFLRSLSEQSILDMPGADAIQVVHGSPRHPRERLFPNNLLALDQVLEMIASPVLVCGHTHVQWSLRRNGKLVVNPGAVAGTQVGPRAQYTRMSWDGQQWSVDSRTVDYNFTRLKQAFEISGLLAEGGPLARGFLLSMETGHDYMMGFLSYAYTLARESGLEDGAVLPDEIFERASHTFCWEARE